MHDTHPTQASESFESYHQRNCKICCHPDRAAIEYDYLHWRSPERIARDYDIPWRAVYRHAHAVSLVDRRRRNLRSSLEFLIEGASRVEPTPDGVLRAVQLYARMNEAGELLEVPKTQVIVISRDGMPPGSTTAAIPAPPEMRFAAPVPVTVQLTSAPAAANDSQPPVQRARTETATADRSLSGLASLDEEGDDPTLLQLDNPIQTEIDVSP